MLAFFRRHPNLAASLFGIALCCVVIGGMELIFSRAVKRRAGRIDFAPGTIDDFFATDPVLGYRVKPNVRITGTRIVGDHVVYRADYSTDALGRRRTPSAETSTSTPGARQREFMLFFSCSFTFGQGVNDDQTMPNDVGLLAHGIVPYNYAGPGYGPQQMLEIMKSDALPAGVREKDGWLVYSFIDDHLRRAIGSMRVYATWGDSMPYYVVSETGALERHGNFMSGRPWASRLYGLLWRSATLRYLGFDLPIRNAPEHTRLLGEIILATRAIFAQKFSAPADRFVVLIYPSSRFGDELISYLEPSGVRILDYSKLFPLEPPRFRYEDDEHPTAEAHRVVAQNLVRDLGLGREKSELP